ncbi:hypothetical protein EHF_0327 [Ehrlichia japonica]|uniref:Uncharacterized protein n=1 Tax=Ehrlichia japonica TaxID=391036 RepID=X5GLC4_9RICK|nr:hypothetical protein EHF_0327 [Ehrlichia japonica]
MATALKFLCNVIHNCVVVSGHTYKTLLYNSSMLVGDSGEYEKRKR